MSDVWRAAYVPHVTVLSSVYGASVSGDDRGKKFADLLRAHRMRKNLRQEDVADISGVSLSTVSRWERGQVRNPIPEEFKAVCRAVGLDPVIGAQALGYLPTEDVDIQPPRFSPSVEEAISIFEDPDVPENVKQAALEYLLYLRDKAGGWRPETSSDRRIAS